LQELENGSRPEEIELAEAAARAAAANMEYAKSKLARTEELFKNASGMSRDEYEAAQAAAIAAIERTSESQASLELARKGPRVEQIQQAKARVEMQKEMVSMLLDRLEKYTIRAPFDGFVSVESTETGAWVQQGDAIADVVEIDPVEVEVFVPESSIRFVKQGDRCTINVDAVGHKDFPGTVDQIIPLADNRSRTFPVRILVENPKVNSSHMLLPGMLARASLPVEQPQMRMLVPKDALQFGDGTQVLMKVEDGKAVLVPVRQGPALDDWIAIDPIVPGAVRKGDQVVTRGNERLRPGQDLIITQPQSPPQ
jgi:RND family efflux transporter MFP subunit